MKDPLTEVELLKKDLQHSFEILEENQARIEQTLESIRRDLKEHKEISRKYYEEFYRYKYGVWGMGILISTIAAVVIFIKNLLK